MKRVPIRLQLTATFALAMAVVLAVGGFLLYHHLATSLDRTIAQSLRARTADISALVQQADTGLRDSKLKTRGAYGFAQVLGSHGRIFDQTPSLGPQPLLTPARSHRARRRRRPRPGCAQIRRRTRRCRSHATGRRNEPVRRQC